MRFSRCATIGATLVGLTSIATPALGGSAPIFVPAPVREDMISRHISYADLNLATAAGERTLVGRVRYAVGDMCTEAAGSTNGSFMFRPVESRCSQASWDQARPQIDAAVRRAQEIAMTGKSSIAAAALVIAIPADK